MVEGAGFEPAKPFQAAILQTAPINHSGTPPHLNTSPRGGSNPLTLPIRARIANDPSGLSPSMTEPERGLEPTDLPFTRRLLYLLSYSGIEASITERGIGVNCH